MHIREILFQAKERFPDREAIVDDNQRFTYQQWTERSLRVAASFMELGIQRGDRVAIGMRNSLDHVTVFMACQIIGAAAVPFNIRLKPESISHIMNDSGSTAIVIDDSIDLFALRNEKSLTDSILWIDTAGRSPNDTTAFSDCLAAEPLEALPAVDKDDLSTIIYTSGTTGLPKGVPLTQLNSYARLVTYIMSVGPSFDSGTRTLGVAPLYHTVGMHWIFLQTVFTNGTYYALPKMSPSVIDLIKEQRLTYLFGSPTIFKMLAEWAPEGEVLPDVQQIAYGSAPAEPELLADLYALFPNATISEVYGTTELSIPFVTPSMKGLTPGTLRRTGDHLVRIIEPGGDPEDIVAPGKLGELIVYVKNDGIFSRYWGTKGQEKFDEKCLGDWFHTGDGFTYDADGNYFFDGRLDDMFVSGGENIQPAEIENVLNGMPGILDSVVFGAADPKWSMIITALIVTDGRNIGTTDIEEFCRESRLENYKRPRVIHFVDEIPRNPSGKIVRARVAERYRSKIEASRKKVMSGGPQ